MMAAMKRALGGALGIVATCLGGPAFALEVSSRGEVGVETRAFQDDNQSATQDYGVAGVARVIVSGEHGDVTSRMRGFVRHDQADRGRSALFAEEAWVQWRVGDLRLRAGWDMLNWTATEAFHPADIMNSRYFDSSVENFEKIGEPMVQARYSFLQGNISAYFMPHATDPIFPSARSRLSLMAPGVASRPPLWIGRDGEVSSQGWAPQWAVRVQQTIGDADVSLHVVQQQDRLTPWVALNPSTSELQTFFSPLTQVGGTYQQALGGWVVKVESAYRFFARPTLTGEFAHVVIPDRNHGLVAAGAEYRIFHDNGWETTLLVEGQSVFGEGRGAFGGNKAIRRSLNIFQRDVMVGGRLSFQDEDDKALLAFLVVDAERPKEFFVNVGYGQRLGDTWTVKTGVRVFHLPPKDPGNPQLFERWNKANQLYFTLLRHF